jgi:hypothetical protein
MSTTMLRFRLRDLFEGVQPRVDPKTGAVTLSTLWRDQRGAMARPRDPMQLAQFRTQMREQPEDGPRG